MNRRVRYLAHPATNEICKFLPRNPPMKGDIVLIDGRRCRVTRAPKLDWQGPRWTIRGPLAAREDG